jgi:O-antigen ligase
VTQTARPQRRSGLQILLILSIYAVTASCILGLGLNIAPGLSAKNLLLYTAAVLLFLESLWGRAPKFEVRPVQWAFVTLIVYALLSVIIAGPVVQLPNYKAMDSLIQVKGVLLDWTFFFCVFFYGSRSAEDVEALIKAILIAVSFGSLFAIAKVAGLVHIGVDVFGDEVGLSRRVYGVWGHSNETGALVACLLPAYIAVVESSLGLRRLLWIVAMMTSVTMLILTASRGAFTGLFIGSVWGALLCHRYLSLQRTLKWLSTTVAVLVPMLIVVGAQYWHQLVARFTGTSGNVDEMSSGRTDIWSWGIDKMLEAPWTFVSGFGWNSWWSMGFDYIPHNEYLWLWFELGVVGVACMVVILATVTKTALAAARIAQERPRRFLVACVFGTLTLAVTIFFANLWVPWFYLWPYLGVCMRYAMLARQEARQQSVATISKQEPQHGVKSPAKVLRPQKQA